MLIPLVLLFLIWYPLIELYSVPDIEVSEEMLDFSRRLPADSVLDEIDRFFGSSGSTDPGDLIASAELILKGKVLMGKDLLVEFGFPFDPEDLDKRLSGWRLFFARLCIPDLLLRAYEVSGRDDFLVAAGDIITGFAAYERNAWLPKGLLWNDHAVAGRIAVLVRFWEHYRNHPAYRPEVARSLLQLVARSGRLLAKPVLFTYATNHGIMQNLALWQICVAFPALPDTEAYKNLALNRMQDQMEFYINDEGVVLEHSAEYQSVGLRFVNMAFNYLKLLNMSIPEGWKEKYGKAQCYHAGLLRPDGTLPPLGDTNSSRITSYGESANPETGGRAEGSGVRPKCSERKASAIYPVAGYSIWWDTYRNQPDADKMSQTVILWSYFPGHGHKHADETSVLLWADGCNWWTNVGLWPYGTKGRSNAVSWNGSNAPHLVDEPAGSKRKTVLRGYGWSENLRAIDLEREGPHHYRVRRQVLHVSPDVWLILDHTQGDERQRTMTIWTTSTHVNLKKGSFSDSYVLEAEGTNLSLTKHIFASENTSIRQLEGSTDPFAGWEGNQPAPGIVIEQPANDSWTAVVWMLHKEDKEDTDFPEKPFMDTWKGPDHWRMIFPLSTNVMSIQRENGRIMVQAKSDERGGSTELTLSEAPQITDQRAEIRAAFKEAAKKYPKKSYSMPRNVKATGLVIVVLLVQEIFFLIYARGRARHYTALRGTCLAGWIAAGSFLFWSYL